jgi:hypothetical protein
MQCINFSCDGVLVARRCTCTGSTETLTPWSDETPIDAFFSGYDVLLLLHASLHAVTGVPHCT